MTYTPSAPIMGCSFRSWEPKMGPNSTRCGSRTKRIAHARPHRQPRHCSAYPLLAIRCPLYAYQYMYIGALG